jgi:hypothetical protein|tara:strand:- start:2242 stop:3309 length:1068 start_codon:yes stop_codon:yes gene_type:complete
VTLRHRKQRLAQTRRAVCAIHPDKLLITKYGDDYCYYCDAQPVERIRTQSETEKYATGATQNAAIQSKMRQIHGDMTVTQQTALELVKPSDLQIANTGKELEQSIDGYGSNLPDSDLILATQLTANGFQPMHMNVIHGKLYLNYKGRVFWTKRALGALDGGATDRPMTAEERTAYQLEDNEVGIVATIWKLNPINGERMPFENFGRAGGSRDASQPVAKANPAEMAVKRAYCRAMELACPLGVNMETLVSGYEAISPTGEARSLEAPIDKAVEIDGLTASVQQEFILEVVEGVKSLGEIDIEKFVYEGASGKQGIARMARSVETYSVSEIVESVKLMCISAQADEPEENIEELPW